MSCSRGQANPSSFTRVKLFANSGGYCQRPECNEPLFKTFKEKEIHIAEIAHIISVNIGARARVELSTAEKGSYANLILLCPNCHTIIDKNEKDFPETLIKKWKIEHENRLSDIFGIKKFDNRLDVHEKLSPLFAENKTIFDLYGPETDERFNPESEMAQKWLTKIRTDIIPNNRKILNIINSNMHLLTTIEKSNFQLFNQHVKDFEDKHVFNSTAIGIRFPHEITTIYV